MRMMKAAAFIEKGRIELIEKPIPSPGPNDALLKITTTTICGTDIHILKGEYAVPRRLTIGHEPVGIIEKLGSNVKGFQEGSGHWLGLFAPLLPPIHVRTAFPRRTVPIYLNAAAMAIKPRRVGASATLSTALRLNMSWCLMRKLIWRSSPTV